MKTICKNRQIWRRFLFRGASICVFICLSGLLPTPAAASEIGEYTLKAVYMWRLPSFIEWPGDAEIRDASKPFIISVIGANPFSGKLEALASKKTIFGKKVIIRHVSDIDEIKNAHILFIGRLKEVEVRRILSFTGDKPILTVSDMEEAAEKGALVNFRITKNKLGFEINETAAHRSGLVISSRLLRIATRIVDPLKR